MSNLLDITNILSENSTQTFEQWSEQIPDSAFSHFTHPDNLDHFTICVSSINATNNTVLDSILLSTLENATAWLEAAEAHMLALDEIDEETNEGADTYRDADNSSSFEASPTFAYSTLLRSPLVTTTLEPLRLDKRLRSPCGWWCGSVRHCRGSTLSGCRNCNAYGNHSHRKRCA
ncbi:LAFE_0C01640g1_1 [Lachancea fermentati]|uniref:LAFE_0C01640g1_1 n=1 Tax=Lachancea fermentati TaxID=4955 RepID=A0A1G4M8X7_LACFM|nr:LAFE_0C01640g1_1 [Lachancea fermentati]